MTADELGKLKEALRACLEKSAFGRKFLWWLGGRSSGEASSECESVFEDVCASKSRRRYAMPCLMATCFFRMAMLPRLLGKSPTRLLRQPERWRRQDMDLNGGFLSNARSYSKRLKRGEQRQYHPVLPNQAEDGIRKNSIEVMQNEFEEDHSNA